VIAYVSLACFLVTLSACNPSFCPKESTLYGELHKEVICYQGERIKHGKHIKWHKKSKRHPKGEPPFKAFERSYKDNQLDGLYREWYTNGLLKSEVSYSRGMLSGSYKRWYANGNLQFSASYRDNQRVGPYVEYYKNGKPRLEKMYNEYGVLEGLLTQYRLNGFKIRQERYAMGKLLERKYWKADGTPDPVIYIP
jgi:hypothetical protein